MTPITIQQDDTPHKNWDDWCNGFNDTDEDMIPMQVVAAWDITHTGINQHAHVVECVYPGNEKAFYEHDETNGDYYYDSFADALGSAVAYLEWMETKCPPA